MAGAPMSKGRRCPCPGIAVFTVTPVLDRRSRRVLCVTISRAHTERRLTSLRGEADRCRSPGRYAIVPTTDDERFRASGHIGQQTRSAAHAPLSALGSTYGGSMVFDSGFDVETAGVHPTWHPSEVDIMPERHPAPSLVAGYGEGKQDLGRTREPVGG